MAEKTGIGWTDATWPVVEGCDYDSPGCTNCYAPGVIWRLAHNPNPKVSGPLQGLVEKRGTTPIWTGKIALRYDRLEWPLEWKACRIFVPSLGDPFHEDVPDAFRDQIFAVMWLTPEHTYQVLTKRERNLDRYMNDPAMPERVLEAARAIARRLPRLIGKFLEATDYLFNVPRHIWIGVSVEDQERADRRLPWLLKTPAALRFISLEPMLGPVDLKPFLWKESVASCRHETRRDLGLPSIDWVIIGGESGTKARPCAIEWQHRVELQCEAAGIPLFRKQLGTRPTINGKLIGEAEARGWGKGADPTRWPSNLRTQQFPVAA